MHPVTFRDPFQRTSQTPVVAVIPARFASTRFPGKLLADLAGRPVIEHVYQRAAAARGIDAVVVATDDERIADAVARFGGLARMTQSGHKTGTDRIAEVVSDLDCVIVVHVQGDEPLVEPAVIEQMVRALTDDPALPMSTLRTAIRREEDYTSPHVVKVTVDREENALYFSRSPIPFYRDVPPSAFARSATADKQGGHHDAGPAQTGRHSSVVSAFRRTAYKHLGLYAYRRDFLLRLAGLPQTPLEQAESLEQLRALEHGFRIRAVETHYDSIGVDTPEDLERARQALLAART